MKWDILNTILSFLCVVLSIAALRQGAKNTSRIIRDERWMHSIEEDVGVIEKKIDL